MTHSVQCQSFGQARALRQHLMDTFNAYGLTVYTFSLVIGNRVECAGTNGLTDHEVKLFDLHSKGWLDGYRRGREQ